VLFKDGKEVVAYALYREQPKEIYLRQLFVVRPWFITLLAAYEP
jgi:hypothetical protein